MGETIEKPSFLVDADDYLAVVARVNERRIQESFVGIWSSRETFGNDLFADSNAAVRLQLLPLWLQDYVRLDGEALVRDLEADGLYVVADIARGICVFDGPAARND